jgi:pyruvate dehydrogenase E2 component (dihydrolipoamide acetyltransferase)
VTESAKGPTTVLEPTRAEQLIARRVAESRATVPGLELSDDAHAAACVELHRRAGLSLTAMLARACALALRATPRANAAYRDGRFELYERVNVGVVLPGDEAYVIATVFDADQKSLEVLSDELRALTTRAAAGELTAPETSGSTFTLLNLGAGGPSRPSAVLVPPQAAAIATGSIRETPVVREGHVEPGLTMGLTLVCDHRILYGAHAAAFLRAVKSALEWPQGL